MARVFFCGDIINQFSDSQFIGDSLAQVISGADYAVCNLEGALASGKEQNQGMLQSPSTLQFIKESGFNLCLLANNHITDYGKKGLVYTLDNLQKIGLNSVGAGIGEYDVYKPFIVEVSGQIMGFINVCEAQVGQFDSDECDYGYAWLGWPKLERIITSTKQKVDFLFVCVHAGLEHYELPLKEFRALYKRFCDWGADCVIGSHPHIPQGIEKYQRSVIFYSLGNFYFPRSKDADDTDYENSSFSVIIDTNACSYETIYHVIKDHKVEMIESSASNVDLSRLNEMLSEENYDANLGKQNDRAFDTLVYRLFQSALNGQEPGDSCFRKLKNIVKYACNLASYSASEEHMRYRSSLLQRLVENETYRYLTVYVLKHRNYE